MDSGPQSDALYLDQIMELIQLIGESLEGTDEAEFLLDRTKGDATALRLGAIGEASRKLSQELQDRHPEIEWRRMYALRNIVATGTLAPLESDCRDELSRLDE